ncbi:MULTISPECIES: type II toxin-antitoxin system VapC family toxin [unclassified Rickettsia]|uniref:type II toxin-antitoxin system VapC family toxin n=2 Tax=Rickettsia TaxID=780 RepID=UPI0031332BD3
MEKMKAVFDTNILIDYLLGKLPASNELKQYKNPQISIITKMEILVGTSEDTEEITKKFLDNFTVISLNEEIAEIAVAIRKEYKIKLPDAIIWATAKYNNSLLITRNIKDFPIHASDIKIPYNI